MTTKTLKASDLNQFTGTDNWYRHALVRRVLFTDGAKHVADAGGAYWLIDEIALAQISDRSVAAEEFQLWKLVLDPAQEGEYQRAMLSCDDGNGNIVYTKRIMHTDFPLPEITLYCENNTICLPSER